jgi:hypothetical protein
MIVALQTFPKDVVGVLCSGRVTKHEYDSVLIPAVEKALQTERRVRLYYETTPDFTIDPGAVWEDFRFGVEHFRRWERIAVVTDVDWLRHTIRAFSFLWPARLRVFPGAEVELARAWIVV